MERWLNKPYGISIHALREEGDGKAAVHNRLPNDFYPRPPRGGRLQPSVALARLF